MRFLLCSVGLLLAFTTKAWDYEAHRVINHLALSCLPTNFPGFVQKPEAVERIGFLAGEPDRWRNTPDAALKHSNGPDHYIDMEELEHYGLPPEKLPVFRYDFVAQLALVRRENPGKFHPPKSDQDHTAELVGMLPWALTESYGKLKSGFSYLKAYQEHGGTAEEIENAQQNIIYIMGVMGHWAGDASQPLHTTVHHHGWVGPNPNGYSTNRSIHSFIDGGYFARNGGLHLESLKAKMRSAQVVRIQGRQATPDELFQATVQFLQEQHQLVETLYQLDKAGAFSAKNQQGREFMQNQIVKAAQFLADVWFSAWQQAPPDSFLIRRLSSRETPGQQSP